LIQEALDALPETEDSEFSSKKSNMTIGEQEVREQGSNLGSQASSGISPIDLALCQLVDIEVSKT